MNVLLDLTSNHFNPEASNYFFENKIQIEWDLPFLPRDGDLFECDNIIGEFPNLYQYDLCWIVKSAQFDRIEGILTVTLFLEGI